MLTCARSSLVTGPSRTPGGTTNARSTTDGRPFVVEQRDERFAYAHVGDRGLDVEAWIGAQRRRRSAHGFLVARREGAQRVLHAIAQLAEHRFGNVERVLGDEIHAHALGADQAHHLLDFFQQGGRRIGEQQVRFVEEEHELGLLGVADLGQLLEQLGKQPQQQCRVQLGRGHEPVGGEYVDDAASLAVGAHEVVDAQRRLAEKAVAALLLELEEPALYGAYGRARYVAVLGEISFCVRADVVEHRAQVFEVEQQQAFVVGDLEHEGQHAGLRVVEIEHAREQQRAHFRYGCAQRVALLAECVPENHRARFVREILDLELRNAFGDLALRRRRDARRPRDRL